jgi:hypothetical protein
MAFAQGYRPLVEEMSYQTEELKVENLYQLKL